MEEKFLFGSKQHAATLCSWTFPIVIAPYGSLEVLREMSLKYQRHQFPLTVNTPSRAASLRMSTEEEEEQQAEWATAAAKILKRSVSPPHGRRGSELRCKMAAQWPEFLALAENDGTFAGKSQSVESKHVLLSGFHEVDTFWSLWWTSNTPLAGFYWHPVASCAHHTPQTG